MHSLYKYTVFLNEKSKYIVTDHMTFQTYCISKEMYYVWNQDG